MSALNKEEVEVQWLREMITKHMLKFSKSLSTAVPKTTTVNAFKLRDIQIKFIGVDEAFMLTTCYRARVTFEIGGVIESRSLVVKRTPNLPQELFDSINFAALFGNELLAYSNILPAYVSLAGDIFNLAKFYYGEVGANYANVILDDFSVHGWSVAKKQTNLSLDHILLAVKYLAQFHGCGFAFRHTQPDQFASLLIGIQECRYANSIVHPDYNLLVQHSIPRLVTAGKKYQPDVPAEFIDRLVELVSTPHKYGKWRVAPREPMVTLCHGDFLRNNIAYKYANENYTHPLDVMMFDLQTMRLSSPMMDLTILLNISTFAEVRHTHFDSIFQLYCDELTRAFERFAPLQPLPEYLNHDTLLREYTRFLPYSVSIGVCFLPALVAPKHMTSEEMLLQQRTAEDIIDEARTRGGEVVDREVAHQIREMYDLAVKYNVDVYDGYPA